MKKLVEFKSLLEFYSKERIGLKPNTMRKCDCTDFEDHRFKLLEMFAKKQIRELWIKIRCAEKPTNFFIRKIKDVSIYDGMFIISWELR